MSDPAPSASALKTPREKDTRREPVMRSQAHRRHADLGAVFARRGAWEVPASYGSGEKESEALRAALGFADLSAQGKLHLSGDVEPLIRRVTGQPLDTLRTAPAGMGRLVARIARDWALVFVEPSGEKEVLTALDEAHAEGAVATDITSGMSGFLVAGPRLNEFLARSMSVDVSELKPGRCAAANWARIPAVVVVESIGQPAVEIYMGSEYGRYSWDTLSDLCARLGGSPVGWTALESLGWRRR